MTVLDHSPRTSYSPRLGHRREIVTTGGMEGVLRIGAALARLGYPVRDFTVEVRDGVPYSSVICTVSMTGAESVTFAQCMDALPAVLSVHPR